jgi:arylsulfatase A-like enzyme
MSTRILATVLASLSVMPCNLGYSSQPTRVPDIVLILADDLGCGDLSCYGGKDLRTPNIDRLVAEAMRFDHFRANSCVCSPTRASLLTGR